MLGCYTVRPIAFEEYQACSCALMVLQFNIVFLLFMI